MNVLIVGATGTLGRQVARRALDEDFNVRCLVRNPRKATFLREWGAEVVAGDLCEPETLAPALVGIDAIIDAATTRATDSVRIRQVDWDGKVALIQAAKAAGIDRYIFFSILNAEHFPDVPLMEIKHCTETFLAESGLNYTILRPAGFMQGLVGQYAIPILDNQAVWITGENTPIAYMDTIDIAKFAVGALAAPATEKGTFPVVGSRAWNANEVIDLCRRMSGKEVKIARLPLTLLRGLYRFLRFFQWGFNPSERLMFAEVLASGRPMDAPMDATYAAFNLDPADISTLEQYFQEYFSRILKKLKEINYEKEKKKKKQRSPFKSRS